MNEQYGLTTALYDSYKNNLSYMGATGNDSYSSHSLSYCLYSQPNPMLLTLRLNRRDDSNEWSQHWNWFRNDITSICTTYNRIKYLKHCVYEKVHFTFYDYSYPSKNRTLQR